jgi:hypothetical protein
MPAGRELPAVTKNRNYPQPVKHLKPMALPPYPWSDVFGGCIFGGGLYVWGVTAGFAGWRDFCGWHYEFKFYWGGNLHGIANGPTHGGCNWNNNGNYDYIFRFILLYPKNGTFEALLWSTGGDDRYYMQGEIAESVHA